MNEMEPLKPFLDRLKVEYYRDFPVSRFTTLEIGGKAGYVVVVSRQDQLLPLLCFMNQQGYPLALLGGGSNVAFADELPGLVIIINRTSAIRLVPEKRWVQVDSGLTNQQFLSWAIDNGAGGLEFMAGIPGTIGGAVAVNAGAFGVSIDSAVVEAEIFSPQSGEVHTVTRDYFEFSYRHSKFKLGHEIILTVTLSFTPGESNAIRELVKSRIKYRQENHPPYSAATAGCFFKNPILDDRKVSAGQLIEAAGLKGTTHEHLTISDRHANFIVNSNHATFSDIVRLEKKIIEAVTASRGVHLEREVIYISGDGTKY